MATPDSTAWTNLAGWREEGWQGIHLRPRDIPELRDDLVRFGKGGVGDALLEIDAEEGRIRPDAVADLAEKMRLATLLSDADLLYITPEMCDLVTAAASQLPDEFDLSIDDPPALAGFAWMSTALSDADRDGNPFDIRGFSWVTTSASTMRLAIYIERDAIPRLRRKLLFLQFPAVFPIGSVDLSFSSTLGISRVAPEKGVDSGRAVYAWIKAFWLLSRQPLAERQDAVSDRAERRRAARQGRADPPPVRVIRLRRPANPTAQTGGTVNWHHQWIVRGHWRLQPYGPGRQFRRPVWISPFVKGPEGAPMLGGEKVYVVDSQT